MFQRTIEGQPVGSVRQLSQLERAQGSRGRSGGQIPIAAARFVHDRPMKGHGWSPFTSAELIRRMADHIAADTPHGASTAWHTGVGFEVATP